MAKSILIGPVPGVPVEDSMAIIVRDIMDKVPNSIALYTQFSDSYFAHRGKGQMLINIKPHKQDDIDDLFIALALQTQKVSKQLGKKIRCEKVDKDIELGDNEGDIPYTPVVGPRQGPPTLEGHQPEPEGELAKLHVGQKPADWWRTQRDSREGRAAAERTR